MGAPSFPVLWERVGAKTLHLCHPERGRGETTRVRVEEPAGCPILSHLSGKGGGLDKSCVPSNSALSRASVLCVLSRRTPVRQNTLREAEGFVSLGPGAIVL